MISLKKYKIAATLNGAAGAVAHVRIRDSDGCRRRLCAENLKLPRFSPASQAVCTEKRKLARL